MAIQRASQANEYIAYLNIQQCALQNTHLRDFGQNFSSIIWVIFRPWRQPLF